MKAFFVCSLISTLLFNLGSVIGNQAPSFEEGAVNSTIDVGAVLLEERVLRCTVVNNSESELKELEIIPVPFAGDNWSINKNMNERWIEVVIHGVEKTNEGKTFECTATNTANEVSFLTYELKTVYDGTSFKEGIVNSTIQLDVTVGTTPTIRCTIESAKPDVTELIIDPIPLPGNEDYKIIGEDKKWIAIQFSAIKDDTPTFFTCTAVSDVTRAKLSYSLSVFDGIKFKEGSTNGTVNHTLVTETQDSIKCTIQSADPPLKGLDIEPPPLPGNEDYHFVINGTKQIEVVFTKINEKTPEVFSCIARNNITTARLNYNLNIKDPIPPLFTFGGNDTIWNEMLTGSNGTLFCALVPGIALPPVTLLTVDPIEPGENWKIVKNGVESIEVKFTNADSSKNNRDFICIATNGVRTTRLIYQNYVGGM